MFSSKSRSVRNRSKISAIALKWQPSIVYFFLLCRMRGCAERGTLSSAHITQSCRLSSVYLHRFCRILMRCSRLITMTLRSTFIVHDDALINNTVTQFYRLSCDSSPFLDTVSASLPRIPYCTRRSTSSAEVCLVVNLRFVQQM